MSILYYSPTAFSTFDILFENKKTCLFRRLIICNIQLLIKSYMLLIIILYYYIVQQVTIIKTYQYKVQTFVMRTTLVDL